MQSVVLRARLETALGERIPSPFTDLDRRVFESVPTGITSLDALTGGLPRGAISEIFGPPSSGRTSVMVSILVEAAAHDEVSALVDGHDAFDPKSAAAAGLELNRLLWVRCHKLDQVLKSTDLLLQGGGFGRVVMDLTDLPLPHVRSIPLASWFRFQRTIEKTPTVLLVMSPENVVKSAASLVLRMSGAREAQARQGAGSINVSPIGRNKEDMSGANVSPIGRNKEDMSGANVSPIGRNKEEMSRAPLVLNGMSLNIEVVRSRRARPSKSYVRVHLHSECVR